MPVDFDLEAKKKALEIAVGSRKPDIPVEDYELTRKMSEGFGKVYGQPQNVMGLIGNAFSNAYQGGPNTLQGGATYIVDMMRSGGAFLPGMGMMGSIKPFIPKLGDFVEFDFKGHKVIGKIRDIDEPGGTAWIMNRDPDTPKMGDGQTTVVNFNNIRPYMGTK